MSFISGIVSDIKSLATDPGKIAKDICDAVLPQSLKAIGDVVGGAIDVETGNPLQALSHMADALKDLPQMAQGLPGTTASKAASTPAGTAAAEPTPPPVRAPSLQQVISELTALAGGAGMASANPATATTSSTPTAASPMAAPASTRAAPVPDATAAPTINATRTATPATSAAADTSVSLSYRAPTSARTPPANTAGGQQLSVSLNLGATAVTVTESVGTRIVGQHDPATDATIWRQVPTTPTFTVTTGPATSASSPPAPAAGSATAAATPATAAAGTAAASSAPAMASSTGTTTPTAAAPASSTGSAAAGSATAPASSTGSTAASSATAPASSTGSTAGGATTPSSLSSLMSMSNDQFMQAVTSGSIPADVANNPSAMAEIQARMNQITQMNQLVTSMMAAMHQMQMAIIQNIRV
jgi:hypothetical protein